MLKDFPTEFILEILFFSIWNFLAELTRTGGKTVVITTHYIEETRLANKVGHFINIRKSKTFFFQQFNRPVIFRRLHSDWSSEVRSVIG